MNNVEMRDILCKIGVDPSDREFIVVSNEAMGANIAPIADEYCEFDMAISRDDLYKRTKEYLKRTDEKTVEGYHRYTAELLFWLYTIPFMKSEYKKRGIPESVLWESMTDVTCKIRECRELYGVTGVYCDWFFLFTAIRLFRLGRLEFEVCEFMPESYSRAGVELKKGDTVFFSHIPSDGRMSEEACIESYKRAYEFFKPLIKGNIMPVVCHTYLFWPPYLGKVFPEDGNIGKFIKSYDVVLTFPFKTFNDCWRVFNQEFDGTTDKLPTDTTLRRNFIKYINDGGDHGNGYGVLLFDGEAGKII